ncbi:MAG: HAMP domain-containing histidine kinase [Candidatus Omnitrophica bacterium]|nr:HAMP domain-containing histidine kinase [Candidatus Omnitrophota bacterium]MCM8791297.1 HAMP domain-containing histidine kinase [Candidatus Omnitrophota bacterium]
MFFQSIRFRMMLWYMLLLALTLLVFSAVLYGSFNRLLYEDLDDLLSLRADGVASSIDAHWNTKGKPSDSRNGPDVKDIMANSSNWIETKRKDPELMSIFVRLLDKDNQIIVSSRNMPRIAAPDADVIEKVRDGACDFDTVKGETIEGKKASFRVYTKPVIKDGSLMYIIQVAGPTRLLSIAMSNLMLALVILLPLTVFLAGMPGLVLVRLTLKPVDKMIDTLKQTTAENLKLKIHIPDTKDEIKRLADTFNDMIERLDRSFSSQQRFIQNISGELKMPLAAMKERFESAFGKEFSAKEHKVILRYGLGEIAKFGRIIEDLELLAKYDNERMALEIRRVSLMKVLEKALEGIKAEAALKGINISSVLKDDIVLDADEKKLDTLFSNLLDNAVKYTNRKGTISVSARKDRRFAVVNVSDTGIGIEESEIPYILDRFYKARKSTLFGDGFGLGLSMAKAVADVHRGTITVESRVGEGSTFTVKLPLSYEG